MATFRIYTHTKWAEEEAGWAHEAVKVGVVGMPVLWGFFVVLAGLWLLEVPVEELTLLPFVALVYWSWGVAGWVLKKGLWTAAGPLFLLGIVHEILFQVGVQTESAIAVLIGWVVAVPFVAIALGTAFISSTWRIARLERDGYERKGTVDALTEKKALHKYLTALGETDG